MADPTVDPAEIEAGMQRAAGEALERYLIGLGLDPTLIFPYVAGAVVLAAVLPDHDARVRADERRRVAEEIRAHAEQHAPAGYPLNHPRTVLRRHLLLAARIADGPLTDDDLAHIAAQVVGLARQHTTTREGT